MSGQAFVVAGILLSPEIGFDDDADVNGVELLIDDGAIANKAAESQVAFDQRRQGRHCPSRIDGARSEPAHLDIAIGESARPERRGCGLISMQSSKWPG